MAEKIFFLRMLTLVGLVLGVLILTMATWTLVQAQGSASITSASITIAKGPDQMVVRDGFINSATVTGRPPVGEDVTDSDAAKVILDEAQTCPTGMIAYWRLDETSGSIYDDFYDGHDGECAGDYCPCLTLLICCCCCT